MNKMSKKSKRLVVLLLITTLLLAIVTPAFAAQKISNPDNRKIDGVDPDPDIGIHNSYAWCAEAFRQTDADYLWVGMNRDMGFTLLGASDNPMAPTLGGMVNLPTPSDDQAGKIYRQKLADSDEKWELVYDNPAISGYRKMILFKGDLFVCAGITNIEDYDYSIILRFKPDFQLNDTPDIVMWENIPEIDVDVDLKFLDNVVIPEYFRSACVFEDELYIGTFDSKIFKTDGTNLQNLTPNEGEKFSGWTLAYDLGASSVFEQNTPGSSAYGGNSYIWDLIGFNGVLYAFVTNAGFTVYKLTPQGGGFTVEQVVGSQPSAKYPKGMGISKNVMASPWLSTAFGQDYIYVSTFANGPVFLGTFGMGMPKIAFDNYFCPAQIYRFDKNDNWELVVGDKNGAYAAKDKAGKPMPRIGNQRAGFFLGGDKVENLSFNQYIWWMAEYDGKLYATTWDMSMFKDNYLLMGLTAVMRELAPDVTGLGTQILQEVLPYLAPLLEQLGIISLNLPAAQSDRFAGGLANSLDILSQKNNLSYDIVKKVLTPLLSSIPFFADNDEMIETVLGLLGILVRYRKEIARTIIYSIPTLLSVSKYAEFSNPFGFDLFVSEDGVTFEPVTVTGFGNRENYGGRVLVPSEYGLFCCTANPFGGGQVWRVDNLNESLLPNVPAKLTLGVGETVKKSVQAIAVPTGSTPTLSCDSDYATAELVKRGTGTTLSDYRCTNEIVPVAYAVDRNDLFNSITNYTGIVGRKYAVREWFEQFPAEMYDIVITGTQTGQETLTLTIQTGSVSATRTVALTVTGAASAAGSVAAANAKMPAAFLQPQPFSAEVEPAGVAAVVPGSNSASKAGFDPENLLLLAALILAVTTIVLAWLLWQEERKRKGSSPSL